MSRSMEMKIGKDRFPEGLAERVGAHVPENAPPSGLCHVGAAQEVRTFRICGQGGRGAFMPHPEDGGRMMTPAPGFGGI